MSGKRRDKGAIKMAFSTGLLVLVLAFLIDFLRAAVRAGEFGPAVLVGVVTALVAVAILKLAGAVMRSARAI